MTNAFSEPRHFMPRKYEAVLGLLLFIFGAWLLYQAYDSRGRKMVWPLSTILPW